MSWRVAWPTDLRADLDIAGPELFERAGSAGAPSPMVTPLLDDPLDDPEDDEDE